MICEFVGTRTGIHVARKYSRQFRYGPGMYHRIGFMCVVWTASAAAAEPVSIDGKALGELVPGATVQLDTPLGTKLPMKFMSNGLISGEAGALSWFLGSATDRGRWWVANDKLCNKWFKWFDAEVQCIKIKRDGEKLFWTRDDGKTGTATLIAAAPIDQAPYALGHPPADGRELLPAPLVAEATPVSAPTRPVVRPALQGVPTVAPKPAVQAAVVPLHKAEPAKHVDMPAKKVVVAAVAPKPAPVALIKAAPIAVVASAVVTAGGAKAGGGVPKATARSTKTMVDGLETVSFRVAGVHPADVLNIRQAPSSEAKPVGAIAPHTQGLRLVGRCQMEWCPVEYAGVSGWVNSYYLVEEDR